MQKNIKQELGGANSGQGGAKTKTEGPGAPRPKPVIHVLQLFPLHAYLPSNL